MNGSRPRSAADKVTYTRHEGEFIAHEVPCANIGYQLNNTRFLSLASPWRANRLLLITVLPMGKTREAADQSLESGKGCNALLWTSPDASID